MNKAKIANIEGLTKPELDYLCEHDYIKVGNKYYISKDRAIELVAQLQANDAEQSDSNCNIPFVSGSLFYKKVEKLVDEWKATNLGEVAPYSPEAEIDAGFNSFMRWLKRNDNDR